MCEQPTWGGGWYEPEGASFEATAIERVPTTLEALSATEQQHGCTTLPLEDPLGVRVLDQFGLPIGEIELVWWLQGPEIGTLKDVRGG